MCPADGCRVKGRSRHVSQLRTREQRARARSRTFLVIRSQVSHAVLWRELPSPMPLPVVETMHRMLIEGNSDKLQPRGINVHGTEWRKAKGFRVSGVNCFLCPAASGKRDPSGATINRRAYTPDI